MLVADLAFGPKTGFMCPESRLRSAYSILGISAGNLGDTLISKWGFRSGGGGRRIKYPSLVRIWTRSGDFSGGRAGKTGKFCKHS